MSVQCKIYIFFFTVFRQQKVDTLLVSSLQKEVVIRTIDEYYSTNNNEQKWSKIKMIP